MNFAFKSTSQHIYPLSIMGFTIFLLRLQILVWIPQSKYAVFTCHATLILADASLSSV